MQTQIEQFDILDVTGKPTGITADKGTKLQDGQYYLGIHVYVYNSCGKFLLQQRSYNKKFLPGGWDILCEHVIAGETSREGALRGLREEIGLHVPEADLHFVERMRWEADHHIVDIYFAKADFTPDELTLQSSEVISAKMVSLEEMLALISQMDYRPTEYRQFMKEFLHAKEF